MTLKITENHAGNTCVALGHTLSIPGEQISKPFVHSAFTSIAPGRVNNYSYVPFEVFHRAVTLSLCTISAVPVLGLWTLGKCIMMIGDCLKKDNFTYIKGLKEENTDPIKEFSIFSWNVCSFFGGLPWLDGLPPASYREKEIVKKILHYKPSIVALQEVSFSSGKKLAHLLKNDYAHIFTRIGNPDFTTMESCLFFATNIPLLDKFFIPFPNESGIRRGYFCAEFENFWVITTHLVAGNDKQDKEKRAQELKEISDFVQKVKHKKHVFLAVDANISEEQEYKKSALYSDYWDPRNHGKRPNGISLETATYTDQFKALRKNIQLEEKKKLEIDDYLLASCHDKADVPDMQIKRIKGFKNAAKPDSTTLSDHHALLCTIKL